MVAIVILLAALVLLMIHIPDFNLSHLNPEPSFIEIKSVRHVSESGAMNYDSKVTLYHNGTLSYPNDELYAVFYRNNEKIPCVIDTLNGFRFISSHHFGVQTIGGLGCQGQFWNPREKIAIDFSDGTFRPGDLITVEIFQRPKPVLISRSSRTA